MPPGFGTKQIICDENNAKFCHSRDFNVYPAVYLVGAREFFQYKGEFQEAPVLKWFTNLLTPRFFPLDTQV
jgi:hypothetical protein